MARQTTIKNGCRSLAVASLLGLACGKQQIMRGKQLSETGAGYKIEFYVITQAGFDVVGDLDIPA